MDNIKKEINNIREKLINYSSLSIIILLSPLVALSIINVINSGWHSMYILYFVEFLIILLLFIFRKKISTIYKAHIIASLFILTGLLGNLFFSLSGEYFLCLIGIALITLFYGKKNGIIYSLISLFGYIVIKILNNYGEVERNIDFNQFNNNFDAWINAIFILMLMAIVLIFSISFFYDYFIGLIVELNNKNKDMKILNEAYQLALKKIEESEIKYKTIFQTLEEGIVITDPDGNIIDCNNASENLLEVSKEQLLHFNLHKQDWGFIRPDFTPLPKDECPGKKALEEGIPILNLETGYIRENKIKWLIISSAPLKLDGYGVFLTFYDITEIKEQEEEHALFNRNFEAFLDHITDFVYFKDKNSQLIFCSQSLANITGYKNWRDIIGKKDFDIFPRTDAQIYYEEEKIIIEERKPLLGKIDSFYDENGEKGYVQTNKWPLFNDNNDVIGIFGISRNITEERKEKELLKEREGKISLLLNSTAEGIYGVDLNSNCTFANKSCVNILGYNSEKDFLGKNMHNLIHHSYEDKTFMDVNSCKISQAIIKGEGIYADDEVFWGKDGTCFPVEYYSYPQVKNGEIVGAVITFTNITERKAIKEQLLKNAKDLKILNSDKDKFIRILAHDLKSPFTSLIGFSELLLNNLESLDDDTIKEYISIINETSSKTFGLLEEILLWLNAQSGNLKFEPSRIEIQELVSNIISDLKLLAEPKEILLVSNISGEIYANADPNMLRTILRNLISNSIKFTNYKGKISINAETADNEIIITVSDNGIGISEDSIKTIFDSIQLNSRVGTGGEKGTGLGLTICKEFVEKHGGKIWVESQVGVGSNFKFTIPLNKE